MTNARNGRTNHGSCDFSVKEDSLINCWEMYASCDTLSAFLLIGDDEQFDEERDLIIEEIKKLVRSAV
jgi:hypothetical protein